MSACVVRWCKRRKERSKKATGITYHSFPKNAIRRAQWITAVRLERREEDWSPSNASRVCSIHFGEEDMYLSPTGNQMLKKTAVPICTMVRYPKTSYYIQTCTKLPIKMVYPREDIPIMAPEIATSNGSDIMIKTEEEVYSREDLHIAAAETATSNGSEIMINIEKEDIDISENTNLVSSKEEQDHGNIDIGTEHVKQENLERYVVYENDYEYDEFNSPIRQHLEQQLSRKTMLAEKRLKKIKMLQRRNNRLLRRNKILKDIIKTLKNERLKKNEKLSFVKKHMATESSGGKLD
ncbi:hypothetical protein evm_004007 [Chilo suppressalis]|nr:hypothetical protein evm_004007 [Chilo suppressalis]